MLMPKARHKWTSEISQIEFTFSSREGSKGKAIWQKREELLLKKGAKLATEPQMNQDGTMNYSARFAKVLRTDHADQVKNNVTTEDIIFPSPNELGIFLRYGGDNSWTDLKDKNGKTLDEWSRV